MATVDECRAALQKLAAKLAANGAEAREKLDFDRSLACRVTDLDIAFHGQLQNGQIAGLTDGDDPRAKIKLTSSSDDLVALVNGELNVMSAWTSGRIKIDAGVFDLLKLRKLL
ncbi:SCP2 sterol-binding domain-containing protein [Dactylosporangium sp. AC04546]|uniref:SCP2 sterol-binding domain-containing protein n=1 Tax=Dactylosporangium sp. AC04546 TaxID=2862460 RepID=UPI001EDD6268|nr:SCP2 sterol-binding domain-containing protein [Dactylosporangium sp. AC04546]WVK81604.1 SCP2 sterol-binding domain-containing protein [Dactylosporangium sp. AC04546]